MQDDSAANFGSIARDLKSLASNDSPECTLFRNVSFTEGQLVGADLKHADLAGRDLRRSNVQGADLGQANLARADLTDADLTGANLTDAILASSSMIGAILSSANLCHSMMTGVNLGRLTFEGATFRLADLSQCVFHNCRGNMASFERASLFATQWSDTVVEDGNFEFADLRNAVFTRCWFGRSCFVGAALEGAQFIECDLTGADFYWSDFDDSKCFNCELKGIRRPEEQKIAYGPKGVKPPVVIPKPLYRQAITDEERQKLLASCLEPPSETTESEPKK